jgi:hypothetical protein
VLLLSKHLPLFPAIATTIWQNSITSKIKQMKKQIFTMVGVAFFAAATAQNGVSGPVGLYGSLYDTGTTINNGGNILVSNGGLWAMHGDIISADKGGPNSPTATGRSEVITFDGSGTYSGAPTTAGAAGNIITGYAASTASWSGSVLPIGTTTAVYPLTVPAGNAVTAAYFSGSGSTQTKPVTGALPASTTEFSQYYDMPNGIAAGSYTLSYPAGLTPGNNSVLSSGNTSSAGTNSSTAYSLLASISNISTSAGSITATLPASTVTQVYMSTSSAVLPITLINFTGVKTPAGNLLNWSAANAVNFARFDVQRSADASSFFSIGSVATNTTGAYNYTDVTASGTEFYRLAMVDVDGSTKYSNVVEITGGISGFAVQAVYPVPANNFLNVNLYTPTVDNVTYTVTDMGGHSLLTEIHAASGIANQQLNVSTLAKGTYILTVTTGTNTQSKKFTKL